MALGIDLTKTKRFEKYINNEQFYNKVFTANEIKLINSKKDKRKLEIMAGRFSAKEAVSKAIGTGIGEVSFKDIEVLNDEKGKPKVYLYNKGRKLWSEKFKNTPEVSISHDGEYTISVITETEIPNIFKTNEEINNLLKKREKDSHKGNYGKVALVGGSIGMCGSIHLSSRAALRTGAGLVYTVVPEEIETVMQIKALENIVRPINYEDIEYYKGEFDIIDSFGIGPGMGGKFNYDDISFYLNNYNKNFIIDADGLNIISSNLNKLPKNKNIIVTPHEMEMSRMTKMDIKTIHENRENVSLNFAKTHNMVVVLKGNNTVVTNGEDIYINNTGNPGMATAGSGDALTGIITTLTAQGYTLFEAAKLGVYIHGISGDIACKIKGEDGIIATDIIENIPSAMKMMKEIIR